MQLIEFLEKNNSLIGAIQFILLLTISGLIFIIKTILQNSFNAELEKVKQSIIENSNKNLTQYNKVYENIFDTAGLSNLVLKDTIVWGDRVRIEIYQKVSNLFFEILYTKTSIPKDLEKDEKMKILHTLSDKVTNVRVEIFINAIFLGELVDPLLRAQIALWDDIPIEDIDSFQFSKRFKEKAYHSSDEIQRAEKWIIENMNTTLTLKTIGFTTEQLDLLNQKRKETIDNILGEDN